MNVVRVRHMTFWGRILFILLTSSSIIACSSSDGGGGSSGGSTPSYSNLSTYFNGSNQRVDFSDINNVFATGSVTDCTISFWVRFANTPAGYVEVLGASNAGWNVGLGFYISAPQQMNFFINIWNANVATNNISLSANQWYHIVGTYSSTSTDIKIYVDGDDSNSTDGSNNVAVVQTGISDLRAGTWSGNFYYNGHIDEVATWDEALTATEITAIYNSGVPVDVRSDFGNYASSTNLTGYWRMGEDDSHPTITDQAGANDATMTSMSNSNFDSQTP